MFEHYKAIHFTGIGGIGMSGIAEVLLNLGYEVTGSDLKESETTERLKRLGAKIHSGHMRENVRRAHVVVISSAVPHDNPEVVEARKLSIPVIPRAEMLAEIARLKYSVLVAGAHGKTTTTSLVAAVLQGFDPTVVIGGKLKAIGTNARLGKGEFFVAEADESDGSFLKLSPTIGVVTNIDREHMDFFKTMDALKEAFLSFMNKVPFYGVSIVCADNEYVKELLPLVHRKVLTYGLSGGAELLARRVTQKGMRTSFEAVLRGKSLGRFEVSMPGMHNVLNSLAAIAVGLELRVSIGKIRASLSAFEGIQRRLEYKGTAGAVKVYDDYGHHPAEIMATISALKGSLGSRGRLAVIFQPHRYTRTKSLFKEFASAFGESDALYLMDIYPAGERPIKGITGEALFNEIRKDRKAVYYVPKADEAISKVGEDLSKGVFKKGDAILTLGAGDVWKTGEAVIRRMLSA